MDPLMALMGQTPTEEQQRMMAQALRGQLTTGARLGTSTIAPVAQQGQNMQAQARDTAADIGRQKYMNESTENTRASILQRALADARQTEDSQFSKISGGRADKLYEETEKAGTVMSLAQGIASAGNTSGVPFLGSLKQFMGTNLQALAPEDWERDSDVWRDWNMEYNNIIRNGIFGSALTASEAAAWKAASINPNMDPEQIRRNVEQMQNIVQYKAAKRAVSLINEGRPKQWVYDTYVDVLPESFWENPSAWRQQAQKRIEDAGENVDPETLSDQELLDLIESKRRRVR